MKNLIFTSMTSDFCASWLFLNFYLLSYQIKTELWQSNLSQETDPLNLFARRQSQTLPKLLVRRYFPGTTIFLLRVLSCNRNCRCHGSTQRVAIVLMETRFCEVWECFESETFGVTQNYTDDFYFGFHRIVEELRHSTRGSVSPQFYFELRGGDESASNQHNFEGVFHE